MKLTSNKETLAENKVLILYILNKIDRQINNDELFQLVLSIEDMNYFYFQQFLLDLLENKYIEKKQDNSGVEPLYSITSSGKEVLELTKDLIPGITKLKMDQTLKGELKNIEKDISIISEFTPEDNGGFLVTCKVMEFNQVIFEISTLAHSREQAKEISDNWKENAISLYPQFIQLLTKPNQE